jgi:hypothetical protein
VLPAATPHVAALCCQTAQQQVHVHVHWLAASALLDYNSVGCLLYESCLALLLIDAAFQQQQQQQQNSHGECPSLMAFS